VIAVLAPPSGPRLLSVVFISCTSSYTFFEVHESVLQNASEPRMGCEVEGRARVALL
jgi:hypothetical protein